MSSFLVKNVQAIKTVFQNLQNMPDIAKTLIIVWFIFIVILYQYGQIIQRFFQNRIYQHKVECQSSQQDNMVEVRLPNIICIGAKKCGTGAFQQFLSGHPQIVRTSSKVDEPHFFDQDENYEKGVDYYRNLFEPSKTQCGKISVILNRNKYFIVMRVITAKELKPDQLDFFKIFEVITKNILFKLILIIKLGTL